jgi:hypothetical protein
MDLIDIGLFLTYLLFFVAVGASVVLPLLHAVKTPKTFIKSLIAFGGMAVIFAISYMLSGSDVSQSQVALGVTETSSKLIGAGLTMFYFALLASIIGMVYSEFHKAIK